MLQQLPHMHRSKSKGRKQVGATEQIGQSETELSKAKLSQAKLSTT
jgi:hypothetical protein